MVKHLTFYVNEVKDMSVSKNGIGHMFSVNFFEKYITAAGLFCAF